MYIEILILLLVYTIIAVSETDTEQINHPKPDIKVTRRSENVHQMVS
jgi:hypothetical protein